jgi:hypothetical protein
MIGRDGDVKRIYRRLLRQGTSPNQFGCKLRGPVSERENWNPTQCPQSASARRRIAESGLIENDL